MDVKEHMRQFIITLRHKSK